ncbi:MAG TPA: hypothetical protein VKZ65_04095 [Glycomyces sp.]|nr:hypothetical protein [Glycomyces sp.]
MDVCAREGCDAASAVGTFCGEECQREWAREQVGDPDAGFGAVDPAVLTADQAEFTRCVDAFAEAMARANSDSTTLA